MFAALTLFLLATIFLVYIPGRVILQATRISLPKLEELSLSLTLGITFGAFIYWLFAYFSLRPGFLAWPLASLGFFAFSCYSHRKPPGIYIKLSHILLAAIILLGIAALAVIPVYFPNATQTTKGGMRISEVDDASMHIAFARELTHTIPPNNPEFAGWRLSYHIGSDLPVAMFASVTGLDAADLTVRYVPILFVVMTTLAIFTFARRWLKSDLGAAPATFLILFGEDLSYIPGLLRQSPFDWSAQYFCAPTTFSLFSINPMLPAVGLMFSGLLCLEYFLEEKQFRWMILSSLIFAGLAECKIFVAANVGLSMAVVAAIQLVRNRDIRMLLATVVTGLCMLPIVIAIWLTMDHGQGAQYVFTLTPDSYLRSMIEQFGWTAGFQTLPRILWYFAVTPIYVAGCYGLRLIGFKKLLEALFTGSSPIRQMMAIFVVTGAVFGLAVSVLPKGLANGYNNSVWFIVCSKHIAWLFAVEAILNLRVSPSIRMAAVAGTVAISIPATIQHFITLDRTWHFIELGKHEVQVLNYLKKNAEPGAVVLAPSQMIIPTLTVTNCHVPVGSYAGGFIPADTLKHREDDLVKFWMEWRSGNVETTILNKHFIDYVLVNTLTDSCPKNTSAISLVFEHSIWKIFRVGKTQENGH